MINECLFNFDWMSTERLMNDYWIMNECLLNN